MNMLDPVIVMRPGGRVEWLKEKGPEHVVTEYYIYSYLGKSTFAKHNELFKRMQACSYELGALAIICRNYAIKRDKIQEFHDKYLTGPTLIPVATWNGHHQWLEEAVVDIESFFWFANRFLTHVALTLNYFFKKIRPDLGKGKGVKSHTTFVRSEFLPLLPDDLQQRAKALQASVSEFRNADVEHNLAYWRTRKPIFEGQKSGDQAQVTITFPPGPTIFPEKPLRDLWIELHDYAVEVAKFLSEHT
jgi:hypothetical protein